MYVIVDTETTGGNPAMDRVMEIAVFVHDGTKVVEQYSTLVNPQRKIDPFIMALTGISNEMVLEAPTFEDISDKILSLTEDNIIVAHNVLFDYGILRNEYRRLGVRFNRKQLCTVKLSRKLLPGLGSYSLGKLCKEIGIEVAQRHRAFGDAEATVKLFERLLSKDKKHIIEEMLEDVLKSKDYPPNISKELVDDLPEETGVYFILDNKKEPLYIGKSRNIKSQVIKHFSKDFTLDRYYGIKPLIHDIVYELTGSELISHIMCSEEIRKKKPAYNHSRDKSGYRYGLIKVQIDSKYYKLNLELLSELGEEPILKFTSRRSGINLLRKIARKHHLSPMLCSLDGENQELPSESYELYNLKVDRVIANYPYKHRDFFIIGDGRSHHEQSVVWIENYIYKGFGYFEPEYIENDIESLKESVESRSDNPEVDRIIREWVGKKTKDEIIHY